MHYKQSFAVLIVNKHKHKSGGPIRIHPNPKWHKTIKNARFNQKVLKQEKANMALLDNTAHAMYAAAHGMTSQYHVNLMNSRIMATAAAASANTNTIGGGGDPYSGSGITETSPNHMPGYTQDHIPNHHYIILYCIVV